MEDQQESLSFKSVHSHASTDSLIEIQFNLSEKNWAFIKFNATFRKTDPLMLVQDKIKNYHGSIKNLELYVQPTMKQKIQYSFKDKIESKLSLFPAQKGSKIVLYYKYDNGYEWPLFTSESFRSGEKKQVET